MYVWLHGLSLPFVATDSNGLENHSNSENRERTRPAHHYLKPAGFLLLRPTASSGLDLDAGSSEIKLEPRRKGITRVKNSRPGHKSVLPSVITGNVSSLDNNTDELTVL